MESHSGTLMYWGPFWHANVQYNGEPFWHANVQLVWFPDPSVMRMRGRGKKGLGNNYTLARARGWNLQKVLESISSRCYTNFCPQVVLATCTIRLRNCLFVNIHDRVTLSANHSHLEVRAGQIPGPVREYSYFPDPSFPSRACA